MEEQHLTPEQKAELEKMLGGDSKVEHVTAMNISDPMLAQGATMALRMLMGLIRRGDSNYEFADRMGNQFAALVMRNGPVTFTLKELEAAEQYCVENKLALASEQKDGTVTLLLRKATPEERRAAGGDE